MEKDISYETLLGSLPALENKENISTDPLPDKYQQCGSYMKSFDLDLCGISPEFKHHPLRLRSDSEGSGDDSQSSRVVRDEVCGTEYVLNDITAYEFGVIGTYIDPRIIPGFKYKVRRLDDNDRLFNGQARTLINIGMGYGKRITFDNDEKNYNPNFFWSDNAPSGYAFRCVGVNDGDEFDVYDEDGRPIGSLLVMQVMHPMHEIAQSFDKKTITKTVKVTMCCDIDFDGDRHGLIDMRAALRGTVLEGLAYVIKERGQRFAVTNRIERVHIPNVGSCILHNKVA